ncbi:MAG: hypothetical protein CO113_17810 [Elusimicrobia bacterium CG_4_9_14_3_um_filter_62_55]|nr:MAG: hypothetical protein CO113_17810 [Elusimicrobia bacterium CG_4_9_14_3_um_filter_62_55]
MQGPPEGQRGRGERDEGGRKYNGLFLFVAARRESQVGLVDAVLEYDIEESDVGEDRGDDSEFRRGQEMRVERKQQEIQQARDDR